jgi:hypothetical protein
MNTKIETKLKELLELSLTEGAPAAQAVIHLLYANYLNGTQNDFAKWCCQYTVGLSMSVGLDTGSPKVEINDSSFDKVDTTWIN